MEVNVGTVGHVDRCNTTLTAALVKMCGEVMQDGRSIDVPAIIADDRDCYGTPRARFGKGQRKANKANRWR